MSYNLIKFFCRAQDPRTPGGQNTGGEETMNRLILMDKELQKAEKEIISQVRARNLTREEGALAICKAQMQIARKYGRERFRPSYSHWLLVIDQELDGDAFEGLIPERHMFHPVDLKWNSMSVEELVAVLGADNVEVVEIEEEEGDDDHIEKFLDAQERALKESAIQALIDAEKQNFGVLD